MKEDEDITAYFLRVNETVNAIIGLGEEIEESVIVQKVLKSLPMRFNPKISTLEERSDLNSISMDELHGIFTTYEMRTEQENPYVKEVSFKASKRSKQKKKEQEEYSSSNDVLEDDEEVANFVKRLNKGTNGRYRGNLPLICFNCDGIGHFANKCPHKKNFGLLRKHHQKNLSFLAFRPSFLHFPQNFGFDIICKPQTPIDIQYAQV
jgi:hypothetical protein